MTADGQGVWAPRISPALFAAAGGRRKQCWTAPRTVMSAPSGRSVDRGGELGAPIPSRALAAWWRVLLLLLTNLGRPVLGVGAQQGIDEPHELAGGQDQRPLVAVDRGLAHLVLVVGGVLRTVHPDTVGRLHQVVAQIGVARL